MRLRRTAFGRTIADGFRIHEESHRSGRPVDELVDELAERRVSRRRLLQAGAAGAVAGVAVASASLTTRRREDHLGGRCWTNRGFLSGDLIAEHGGEFISSEHTAVRRLAARHGLDLEDVNGSALRGAGLNDVFWMDGAPYTVRDTVADWDGPAHHAFHSVLAQV